MNYIQQPKNFENINHYDVVGYYRDKSIAKDEEGNLYFIRCEENEVPVGFTVAEDEVESIEKLKEEERNILLKIYGK